jgi:hypothetical protein
MPIFRRKDCIHTASGIFALCKRLHSTLVESRLYCYWIKNCALKLVNEIILYYDARSKRHKKPIRIRTVLVEMSTRKGDTTLTALCSRYAKVHIKLAGALKQVYFSDVLSVKLSLQMQSKCRVNVTFTGTTLRRTRQYASLSESAAQIATLFRSFSLGFPEAPTV